MDGFLIVNKPKGITSQCVCNKIKHKFNTSKVGHSGTLDPNATGVMVVALGRATKTLKLIEADTKAYIARIRFGILTDTLDICGNEVNRIDMKPTLDDIKKALVILKDKKEQIPPLTSAIKVNGKKLYEYQREGKDIELKPRQVLLNDYKILSDIEKVDGYYEISILVDVTKGYYVRSFARDLGELLNGFAILSDLNRVRSGKYSIDESVTIDEAKDSDIISIREFFDLKVLDIKDYLIPLVKNGVTLDERQTNLDEPFYVNSKDGILAIYEPVGNNKYKPLLLGGFDEDNKN